MAAQAGNSRLTGEVPVTYLEKLVKIGQGQLFPARIQCNKFDRRNGCNAAILKPGKS